MKNSIILKFNLVFLTIFGLTISNAQILTNNGQSPLISNSNVLIDGSTNFSTEAGAGSYVGKGIIIPSVDLVNFAFDLTLADGSTFPTYFDGMIVYNNTTGTTLTTGNRSSLAISVAPGFYYFSNPNGASNSNVTGGVWKPLGGVTLTGTAPIAVTSGVISLNDSGVTSVKIANDAVISAKILDGTIENADISSTAAIADTKLEIISTAGKVANSATTATAINTPSTIVLRDASGNFTAGTITGSLLGNATTATSATTSGNVTGTVAIDNGGTGAITASGALTNLGGQSTSNLSTNVTTDSGSTTKYPSISAVETYVGNQISSNATPDATTLVKGKIQLAGDLSGTALEPTIANNAVTSAKIFDGTITSSDLSATAGITNGQLANNSVTINGNSVALGGSTTITHNTIRGTVTNVSSTSYTLAANDYAVITNNATGVTITMPDLTPADAGRTVFIFNNNTAAVANSWGGVTPIGVSTLNQFRAMELMWTGTIWVIMGK